MGSRFSQVELPTRSTTNTQTFLETCVLDADHKTLEEHLVNNQVQQSDLDRCLLRGLQMVQRKEKELSHVAPVLTLLLYAGAKWNSSDALLEEQKTPLHTICESSGDHHELLEEQKTPLHIICESSGDHHELLDWTIKLSQRTLIDARDITRFTAVLYAVQNDNINCLKCLITNGADISIADGGFYQHFIPWALPLQWTPIMQAIEKMSNLRYVTVINVKIFNLLLDSGADVNTPSFKDGHFTAPILLALRFRNIYCVKKLITKGARLDIIGYDNRYAWSVIAGLGKVELLKCMFDHGINKDSTDQKGSSILWHVVNSGNIEAVRYLLHLGANIPSYKPEQYKNNLTTVKHLEIYQIYKYPCVRAVQHNKLEIVKLLEEYGNQCCRSFKVLRRAVIFGSVDVVSYLLNKYTYPLNIEYTKKSMHNTLSCTLLTENIGRPRTRIIKLLLDHGADPSKPMSLATSLNAIMAEIAHGSLKVIAQYIRNGVDINLRSYDRSTNNNILPFEASVLRGYHNVAEILLISGCSCGVFNLDNNHKFKNNLKPEVVKLMKEWKVQKNNVTPLMQRCRSVILNHLSPRADKKIEKLPLSGWLIKFLSISEIDDIVDAYQETGRD